jgi:hypothetical protein
MELLRAGRRRALGLAGMAATAIVLTVSACGGGGGETTTGAASAVQWAGGVCSAVTDWKNTVLDVGTSLKGKPLTSSSLHDAGDQIRDATTTLADTVKGLGTPDTGAGAEARKSIDKLATQLDSGAKAIQDAISGASGVSGVLTATSTVSSTLVTMGSEVSATATELQQLDVQGELGKAFDEADSCKALRNG